MQRGSTSPLSRETDAPETIVKLECDIDDASPEVLAYAADRLRDAGAREVHWLPLYCKKGRPGWQLQVICAHEDIERLQTIVFLETTTNGIRRQVMERVCLPRRFEQVATPWGEVAVKVATARRQWACGARVRGLRPSRPRARRAAPARDAGSASLGTAI